MTPPVRFERLASVLLASELLTPAEPKHEAVRALRRADG